MSLVFRDAFWQIFGRLISALAGFLVVKLLTPYLGVLRYGDYSTVLKYFAIWSALADFGIYVIALNNLGKIKNTTEKLKKYHKFLGFRFFMIFVVYLAAFVIAHFIPSYTNNPFVAYGLVIGMLFSASFMAAGIIQIPLQLNWQMKHVSIALILARIVQIFALVVIIFFIFPNINFNHFSILALIAFLGVLFSVFLSGLTQFFYVLIKGNKLMKFKLDFDFDFIKYHLKHNWKYGFSYFLSSFHTLIVLIFLSILFPTSEGYTYVGIWAVALALIEILLIVPSAFGNSIIHKISHYKKTDKLESLGNYLLFILWFGFFVLFNFILFKTQIISLIAGKKYLTYSGHIGSDYILPFLAIVLFFSFIKQVFNYVLVSFEKQNLLLKVNFIGVLIGVIVGLVVISKWHLYGGIITQLILEICFVSGALFIAKKHKFLPRISFKSLFLLILLNFTWILSWYYLFKIPDINSLLKSVVGFLLIAIFINLFYLGFSYKFIKQLMEKI